MNEIAEAIEVLHRGGLVAFPTETVYGLGADARDAAAVRRVFAVKGRPMTNPLIVHVADAGIAQRYARRWPEAAQRLAERFWPGPLTLVLPKTDQIVAEATAGLETVGLRAPDHPLAMALLRAFDGPLVGPSANRSMRISPTTADHVRAELGGAVDLVLDGGSCRVGIESTVLDLTGDVPRILRPGGVSREAIEAVIEPVEMGHEVGDGATPVRAPGQQAVHYAPAAPAYRFDRRRREVVAAWCAAHRNEQGAIVSVGADEPLRTALGPRHELVALPDDPAAYARQLYAALHALDATSPAAIWVEMPPDEPAWAAVRDRITRATRPVPP